MGAQPDDRVPHAVVAADDAADTSRAPNVDVGLELHPAGAEEDSGVVQELVADVALSNEHVHVDLGMSELRVAGGAEAGEHDVADHRPALALPAGAAHSGHLRV